MGDYAEKPLEDIVKDLQDEIELKYGVKLSYGNASQKGPELWEAIFHTADNSLSFTGEGSTRKEAVIDAFDKAKLALEPGEQ